MSRISRQSGAALITALLVLSLVVAVAAQMLEEQHFDIRRTGNLLSLEQAHQVALGGERWAVAILARDRRGEPNTRGELIQQQLEEESEPTNADVDGLDEVWAQPLPAIPAEGGQIAGRIEDLQGRFNINNLVVGGAVNALALARFERLLEKLELERNLSQAVVDWIDADSETTFPGGAEDDFYLARAQPYPAANRPLAVPSELRQIRGIDGDTWRRLQPHVTALPGMQPVNVNTASPEVLSALLPGIESGTAEQLAATAREEPYTSVDAFLGQDVLAELDTGTERLSVSSSFFRVRADVLLGSIEYTLYSWLRRNDNGSSSVLRRARLPD